MRGKKKVPGQIQPLVQAGQTEFDTYYGQQLIHFHHEFLLSLDEEQ
jgi:hypothetical protein